VPRAVVTAAGGPLGMCSDRAHERGPEEGVGDMLEITFLRRKQAKPDEPHWRLRRC
jgi:hypothetical protein